MINKKPRKRHSHENKIEEISRSQFKELISSFGWQPYDINPDFGLDLRVEIVLEGVSTGLSFFVQLKGTTNSNQYKLKEGRFSYPFDTDNLKDIYQQSIPGYIVLWDIKLKRGWYVSLNNVIQRLNDSSTNWSDQGKVNIHIPVNQELNIDSLETIRNELTQKSLPIYLAREPLKVKFILSFPQDEFGQNRYREFVESVETGKPFEVDKSLIQNIEISDWWIRLMGEKSLDALQIKLGLSMPVHIPPVRIEFFSQNKGAISIDYVELMDIQHGTKQAVLSNEQQKLPYKFKFTFDWSQRNGHFNVTINQAGLDAVEAKKSLDLACLLAVGGEIRIRNLETNETQTLNYEPDPSFKPSENEILYIGYLARIQSLTGIMITIPKNSSITANDLENAKKVLQIAETGHYHNHTDKVSFTLIKSDIVTIATNYISGEYYELVSKTDNRTAKLLSTIIQLGKLEQIIKGKCNIPAEVFDEWLKTAGEIDKFQVELEDVEIIEDYENWKKPAD